MKIKITRVVQTAMACPSQWDAWDDAGNYYYLRYRHGFGSVTQYQTADWLDAPFTASRDSGAPFTHQNPEFIREVTTFEYGDEYDGDITITDFCRLAGLELAENLDETRYGQHLRDQLIMEGLTGFLGSDGDPLEGP